jgi:hypothetical protein
VVRSAERSFDDRVSQTASVVVDTDQHLSCRPAVEKGDDPSCVAVEAGLDDKARHQSFVDRAEVAYCVPHVARGRVDVGLSDDGCHYLLPRI